MTTGSSPRARDISPDVTVFLIGMVIQFPVVYVLVPWLSASGLPRLASWMILSPFLIFSPIAAAGYLIVRREEAKQGLWDRLRLRSLTPRDWKWTLAGLLAMGLGSGAMFGLTAAVGLDSNPPFARNAEPWSGGLLWMFALWAAYWPINILVENIVWRGIILPRFEERVGGLAWLLNAVLWAVFHTAFGLGNILVLVPTLLVVPFVAQKTHNTWTAIILHATLSGPGFMAIAFGLMGP